MAAARELGAPLLEPAVPPSRGSAACLLAAHSITKLGSKAWEFATPLFLLYFSPGSLFAPTMFGLVIFLLRFLIGPMVGAWIDRTPRLAVVQIGIFLQTAGVGGMLLVLLPLDAAVDSQDGRGAPSGSRWELSTLLPLAVLCGCLEAMGALVSSVAVKRDWVPALWAHERLKSELNTLNVAMSNVDLGAEMLGPIGAGIVLQATGSIFGFTVVGLANVISFGFELLLLKTVYMQNPALAEPKPVLHDVQSHVCTKVCSGWPVFLQQPCGAPLLVISYALLYFTVLSPHGVVLTAYLQTRQVGEASLSLFRAAGALSGVIGMGAYRVGSKQLGVRRMALMQVVLLALAVCFACGFFAVGTADNPGVISPGGSMVGFLFMLVVSRFGLYGFDVALLQLEQMNVDERHRGLVGAVESSLCSLGTMTVFVSTLFFSSSSFGALVYGSAGFVLAGALCFATWCLCWHAHEHSHDERESSAPHLSHPHTLQHGRELAASTDGKTHTHLHFHPPFGSLWKHLTRDRATTDKA